MYLIANDIQDYHVNQFFLSKIKILKKRFLSLLVFFFLVDIFTLGFLLTEELGLPNYKKLDYVQHFPTLVMNLYEYLNYSFQIFSPCVILPFDSLSCTILPFFLFHLFLSKVAVICQTCSCTQCLILKTGRIYACR